MAMPPVAAALERIGNEHTIFQQALWIALKDLEIGLETVAGPDGVLRVVEQGRVEIVNRTDGSLLVRRAR